MNTESELHFELGGHWWNIQIVEALESKSIPWRVWCDHKFLAGGMTRDKAIEASKLTIENRLKVKL